jgi:hypothetical protein
MLSFSSLSAQVQTDTVKTWHYLGSQGGIPTGVYTREAKDTSTEGIYSRVFGANLPAGVTAFFGRKLNYSYPRPWGVAYDLMLETSE